MEKSYRQVSLKEAARILYVTEAGELDTIARKVNKQIFIELIQFELFCSSMDGNYNPINRFILLIIKVNLKMIMYQLMKSPHK
jgi:hypothetical protein